MKKRILSVLALVVLAAMLFSSCAINYADEDMALYVSIDESGYKGITLSEKIDKVIIHDEDLRKQVFMKLREKIEDANTESGLIEKFDEVYIHTFAVDEDGDIAMTTLNYDTEKKTLGSAEALLVGYGLNKDMLKEIEQKLYDETDPSNIVKVDIADHLLDYKGATDDKVPTGSFVFVTYSTFSSSNIPGQSSTTTPVTVNTDLFLKEEQGTNDYYEMISLAIKRINDNAVANEDDKYAKVGKTVTVRIFPTATPDEEITGSEDQTTVNLKYDIDFDTAGGSNYDKGTLSFTVKGTAFLAEGEAGTAEENRKATPIIMDYTFPEDYEGQYTKDGKKVDLKGVKTTVYLYLTSKTSYEVPEYDNPETEEEIAALKAAIANKDLGNFTSDTEDITELKKEFEAHLRTDMEKDYVADAEKKALEAIWEQVAANAQVLQLPEANVDAYVQNIIDNIKTYYTQYTNIQIVERGNIGAKGYSISTGYIIATPAATEKYDSYKDYALEMYKEEGYQVETFAQLEATLRNEAEVAVKKMMLTYRLADLLGIDTSDAKYTQRRDAEAAKWIKDTTAEYVKQYGYSPALTAVDYENSYGGKENLHGAYLLEEVKEKLYEMNKDKVVYNEIFPEDVKEDEKK